jgi:hypothetical protein
MMPVAPVWLSRRRVSYAVGPTLVRCAEDLEFP